MSLWPPWKGKQRRVLWVATKRTKIWQVDLVKFIGYEGQPMRERNSWVVVDVIIGLWVSKHISLPLIWQKYISISLKSIQLLFLRDSWILYVEIHRNNRIDLTSKIIPLDSNMAPVQHYYLRKSRQTHTILAEALQNELLLAVTWQVSDLQRAIFESIHICGRQIWPGNCRRRIDSPLSIFSTIIGRGMPE